MEPDTETVLGAMYVSRTLLEHTTPDGLDQEQIEEIGRAVTELPAAASTIDLALQVSGMLLQSVGITGATFVPKPSGTADRSRGWIEAIGALSDFLAQNDVLVLVMTFILTFRGSLREAIERLEKIHIKVDETKLTLDITFISARDRLLKKDIKILLSDCSKSIGNEAK